MSEVWGPKVDMEGWFYGLSLKLGKERLMGGRDAVPVLIIFVKHVDLKFRKQRI